MTDAEIDGLRLVTPERGEGQDPHASSDAVPEVLSTSPSDLGTGVEFGLGTGAGGGSAFGEDGPERGTIITGGETLPVTEEGLPDTDGGTGSP